MFPVPMFLFLLVLLFVSSLFNFFLSQGATDDIISRVPLVVITREHLRENGDEHRDNSCAICLNELTVGEEARILQCKHMFHKQVSSFRVFYKYFSHSGDIIPFLNILLYDPMTICAFSLHLTHTQH